jgi:hypothetical protein
MNRHEFARSERMTQAEFHVDLCRILAQGRSRRFSAGCNPKHRCCATGARCTISLWW